MLREQRWSPDTCDCVLIEEWDDAVPVAARTHVVRRREKACVWHAALADVAGYAAVRTENQRKNLTWTIIGTIRSGLDLSQFAWAFDAQRRVVVTLGSLVTPEQKTQILAACDVQFGLGTVVIQ